MNKKLDTPTAYIILADALLIAILILKFWTEVSNESLNSIEITAPVHIKHITIAPAPKRTVERIVGRVTAFSAVEFCATSYAKRVYPHCNGNTFPKNSVAVDPIWITKGYTAVYVPEFNQTYRIIGRTDGKTNVDIWTGASHAAALKIGTRSRVIQFIK